MSVLSLYFHLGLEHILDLRGFDHLLFLVALCGVYSPEKWKQVVILISAFTLGHCTTLVWATLEWGRISIHWVEWLIPMTILVTSVSNFVGVGQPLPLRMRQLRYLAASFFGMIHGLGFSNYLRSLLGNETSLLRPLLGFNLGVEVGQLLATFVIMVVFVMAVRLLGVVEVWWNRILSGLTLAISLYLCFARWPF